MERARYMAKAIVSIHVPKEDTAKLEEAFALPWDKPAERVIKLKKLTPEERKKEELETIRLGKKLFN